MATSQTTPDELLKEAFPEGVPTIFQKLMADSSFAADLSEYARLAISKSIGKSDEHYRRNTLSEISSRMFKRGLERIKNPFGSDAVELRRLDIRLEAIRVKYVLQRQNVGLPVSAKQQPAKQANKRIA